MALHNSQTFDNLTKVLLYSMTENSLETYTARCQIMALYNSQTFDNLTNVLLYSKTDNSLETYTTRCQIMVLPNPHTGIAIFYVGKTKVPISRAVTAQLICDFVFAYAKYRFS